MAIQSSLHNAQAYGSYLRKRRLVLTFPANCVECIRGTTPLTSFLIEHYLYDRLSVLFHFTDCICGPSWRPTRWRLNEMRFYRKCSTRRILWSSKNSHVPVDSTQLPASYKLIMLKETTRLSGYVFSVRLTWRILVANKQGYKSTLYVEITNMFGLNGGWNTMKAGDFLRARSGV